MGRAEVKEVFEDLKGSVAPDLIIVPRRDDTHQDHRMVAELTWNTFRDYLVLEYEIPKYDGDLGNPNLFVPLPTAICERKVELLLEQFPSQHDRRWLTPDTLRALLRLRGVESNAPSGMPRRSTVGRRRWGLPGSRRSVGALAFEDRRHGLQDDVEVERQRPVLDVERVEADGLRRRHVAAAVDLPPAGHAGRHLMTRT
jgi:hypothetical protein